MIFENKKELKEELYNAELRALTHFRKLQTIERIIRDADEMKEHYSDTIRKIKIELEK